MFHPPRFWSGSVRTRRTRRRGKGVFDRESSDFAGRASLSGARGGRVIPVGQTSGFSADPKEGRTLTRGKADVTQIYGFRGGCRARRGCDDFHRGGRSRRRTRRRRAVAAGGGHGGGVVMAAAMVVAATVAADMVCGRGYGYGGAAAATAAMAMAAMAAMAAAGMLAIPITVMAAARGFRLSAGRADGQKKRGFTRIAPAPGRA